MKPKNKLKLKLLRQIDKRRKICFKWAYEQGYFDATIEYDMGKNKLKDGS